MASIFAAAVLKVTLPEHYIAQITGKSTLGFPLVADMKFITQMMTEAFGFFPIVFAYYMLIVEKNTVKYIYAPGIASVYFVSSIFLIERSGAGMNPA